MTHVIALEAGQYSQGTSEPITPVPCGSLAHVPIPYLLVPVADLFSRCTQFKVWCKLFEKLGITKSEIDGYKPYMRGMQIKNKWTHLTRKITLHCATPSET